MRGRQSHQGAMFSYVSLEERIPAKHPLRAIWAVVDEVLAGMGAAFAGLYASTGRPPIPPEQVLKALLLQAFYSIRSERQLAEQIDFNLLFCWFVGLGVDDPVWHPTVFTKNRDRLLAGDVAGAFLGAVVAHAKIKGLLSDEHFSVDGTLVEAWASMKSFRPKDGSDEPPGPGRNGERNFHGERRSNDTHASVTDPEAKLFRKGRGKEAKLSFMGHVLMENRNCLVVGARLTQASGTAERIAALDLVGALEGRHRITVGADTGYDTADFVADLSALKATPHVAEHVEAAFAHRRAHHPAFRLRGEPTLPQAH
ncbi:transposase [Azospirillum sp. Sp 7]|nr:transposase [Azospirillum sp. Sp 7]TVZ61144.1 transposase, IS4 family [Azospirillum brasilense]TWB80781.1 IS4 family transposase [Azospirillum brasilense]